MKIFSSDKKSWLSIEVVSDDEHGYSSFSMESLVDIGHSSFQGRNSDLHFFGIDDFVAQLSAFVMDRRIQPRLEGTYDSFLMFKGSASHVSVSFCIGSAYCGAETYSYVMSGAFEVEQENLASIVSDLSKFSACF
jgi:hypothetical protein